MLYYRRDGRQARREGDEGDGRAKYHVSEILSKLGVTSREEAALWQPERERALPSRIALTGLAVGVLGIVILGLSVIAWGTFRSGTGDDDANQGPLPPLIGRDHWHASYTFYACDEKQPNAPTWEGVGVHTHDDGVIHMHPFTLAEEGRGARLTKWFDYGGGVLSEDELRVPGFETEYRNGDECPDGTTGEVQVHANGEAVDLDTYIPQDGDLVKIVFGPPDDGEWEGEAPTLAP